MTSDGRVATVTGTRSEAHPDGIAVYNFTVDGDHTYFVTDVADDQAVWVHNQEGLPAPGTHPTGGPAKPAAQSSWFTEVLLKGWGQGLAGLGQGAQNFIIGTLNTAQKTGPMGQVYWGWKALGVDTVISSPQWSKHLFGWEPGSSHEWSVGAGELGIGLVLPEIIGPMAPKTRTVRPPVSTTPPVGSTAQDDRLRQIEAQTDKAFVDGMTKADAIQEAAARTPKLPPRQ